KALCPHLKRRSVNAEKTLAHGRLPLLRRVISKERARCVWVPALSGLAVKGGNRLPFGGKVSPWPEITDFLPFFQARRTGNGRNTAARSGIGSFGDLRDIGGGGTALRVAGHSRGARRARPVVHAPLR